MGVAGRPICKKRSIKRNRIPSGRLRRSPHAPAQTRRPRLVKNRTLALGNALFGCRPPPSDGRRWYSRSRALEKFPNSPPAHTPDNWSANPDGQARRRARVIRPRLHPSTTVTPWQQRENAKWRGRMRREAVTRPVRFERTTCGLEVRCSIQLSYGRNHRFSRHLPHARA